MRPLVAVTGVPITAGGVLGWRQGALAVPLAYLDALSRAGAEPVIVMPSDLDAASAAACLRRFDALVLVGGGDIDPTRYGATETRPEVAYVSPARDNFEIPLARAAVDGGVPTLAICRGAQVLNVALGGTLHQHISDWDSPVEHRSADGEDGVIHSIRAQAGSRLAKAMGGDRADAYSHHHQALDRVADGLVPVAWSADDVLEGVEHEDGWVVGVQWHAEATAATDPAQQAIFDALVAQVGGGPGL